MVKADFWANQREATQLKNQLILTGNHATVRRDPVMRGLVTRAGQRLKLTGNGATVAHQVVIDLGYYLFCHHYQMPRAAFDLLVVAQGIDAAHQDDVQMIE